MRLCSLERVFCFLLPGPWAALMPQLLEIRKKSKPSGGPEVRAVDSPEDTAGW